MDIDNASVVSTIMGLPQTTAPAKQDGVDGVPEGSSNNVSSLPAQVWQMVNFIEGKVLRRPGLHITEDTPLVSSGLIDSLALITLLLELETITNRRIPPGKIQAKDMDTVRLMFATAERVGKPRS